MSEHHLAAVTRSSSSRPSPASVENTGSGHGHIAMGITGMPDFWQDDTHGSWNGTPGAHFAAGGPTDTFNPACPGTYDTARFLRLFGFRRGTRGYHRARDPHASSVAILCGLPNRAEWTVNRPRASTPYRQYLTPDFEPTLRRNGDGTQYGSMVHISPENAEFAIVSFEGPDEYSRAGGLAVRVRDLAETLAELGFHTHLFFIGDPSLPAVESNGRLTLHRWGQWISAYHPGGVYDGEWNKMQDLSWSLPPVLANDVVRAAAYQRAADRDHGRRLADRRHHDQHGPGSCRIGSGRPVHSGVDGEQRLRIRHHRLDRAVFRRAAHDRQSVHEARDVALRHQPVGRAQRGRAVRDSRCT